MDRATRAAKIADIWRQLRWLEGELARGGGAFLAGEHLSHADMTWWGLARFVRTSV
jgi:glutathione S-transferase